MTWLHHILQRWRDWWYEVAEPFDFDFPDSVPPVPDCMDCPDTQPTAPGALDSDLQGLPMITQNFAISEFVLSDTATRLGIDNTPSATIVATLTNILIPAMQQIRDLLGAPVIIKSGYRCPHLNSVVRGSPNSDHLTGHAADFVAPAFGDPLRICRYLLMHADKLQWDQLIFEVGWVHIAFNMRQRNQVLTAHFTPSGVRYTQGLS